MPTTKKAKAKAAPRPRPNGDDSADAARASAVREVVFAPIGGEGLAQQAVRRLAEAIGLGLLKQGDRLPPEAQLAKWLGISALTLREALAILRQAGYIETLRGRGGGTFVRRGPAPPTSADARRALKRLTPEFLIDFTDLRRAISGEASALAAERATPQEVARIQELADEMEQETRFPTYRQLDAAFHIAIASASRSTRLATTEAQLQVELGEIFVAMLPMTLQDADPILRSSDQEHHALARAIKKGDPSRSRALVRAHVSGSLDVLLAFIAA